MNLTGYITRAAPLTDTSHLELFTPNTDPGARADLPRIDFVQDGLSPGAWVKRRQIAESMYMDDATQVQSSKGRIQASFGFFVTGYDADSLQDAAEDLIAAVDQGTWQLVVKMDDPNGVYGWNCWDAEPTPGFPVAAWYGLYMPILVATLRSPIPAFGPF